MCSLRNSNDKYWFIAGLVNRTIDWKSEIARLRQKRRKIRRMLVQIRHGEGEFFLAQSSYLTFSVIFMVRQSPAINQSIHRSIRFVANQSLRLRFHGFPALLRDEWFFKAQVVIDNLISTWRWKIAAFPSHERIYYGLFFFKVKILYRVFTYSAGNE